MFKRIRRLFRAICAVIKILHGLKKLIKMKKKNINKETTMGEAKESRWKSIIQFIITVLTAIISSFFVQSCI